MNTLLLILFLLAAPAATSLDQVKAEPNAEKRARAAIDFATVSEKSAEAAYDKGDLDATKTGLNTMAERI